MNKLKEALRRLLIPFAVLLVMAGSAWYLSRGIPSGPAPEADETEADDEWYWRMTENEGSCRPCR